MSEPIPAGWQAVQKPPSLFQRFEFGSYAETRAFLDALAKLSERTGLYPNLSFGRTYVNVTVPASDGTAVGTAEREFAARAAACAAGAHSPD
jgi:pterin-4a-carbinolamine dehydratase